MYTVLTNYIHKCFTNTYTYTDFYDTNDTRLRLYKDKYEICQKQLLNIDRIVEIHNKKFYCVINRHSLENENCFNFKTVKIVQCQVYLLGKIEFKFEQMFFRKQQTDIFDNSLLTKQLSLYNALTNKNVAHDPNLLVGSDEILASARLELEYENDIEYNDYHSFFCHIENIENLVSSFNISPMIPHTKIYNNIICRQFDRELLFNDKCITQESLIAWAVKYDGTRGRGYICNNVCYIYTDDLKMFSGTTNLNISNQMVTFQVEVLNDTIVIVDFLQCYNYNYDNRHHYSWNNKHFDISMSKALDMLSLLQNQKITICDNKVIVQKFNHMPIQLSYTSLPVDGVIGVKSNYEYVKIKYYITKELQYIGDNKFILENTVITNYTNKHNFTLKIYRIYECRYTNNEWEIIKERFDRLLPT